MSTPNRKAQILEQVRATHQEFEGILAQIAPDRLTQPGVNGDWTVKDVLAHITWWEQHLLRRLRTGQDDLYTPDVDPREATHEVNAVVFAASRERPLDDVRAEFGASYRELLAELEALPPEVATQDEIYQAIGADTFEHYPEHTEMLRAWRVATHGLRS
jgi:Mycothiol maleylpyruvate isomerase N-terminal domain